MRNYFKCFIGAPDGFVLWKETEMKNLVMLSL